MKFEIVSKYADAGLNVPIRKTKGSAGYDFQVAEDILIPSYIDLYNELAAAQITSEYCDDEFLTLEQAALLTKYTGCKPTLVPTGIKCEIPTGFYLELSVRSSCPLKHWLILANGVGIIDADYYNNPDNEGHIFFQIINLAPFPILLKKGDTIGQGILKKYYLTDDDMAQGMRTGGFGSTDNIVNALCDVGLPNVLTPDEWLELGTKLSQPDNEHDYVGKRILANPIDDACVMACNPERRAYVFGVDLAPAAETL